MTKQPMTEVERIIYGSTWAKAWDQLRRGTPSEVLLQNKDKWETWEIRKAMQATEYAWVAVTRFRDAEAALYLDAQEKEQATTAATDNTDLLKEALDDALEEIEELRQKIRRAAKGRTEAVRRWRGAMEKLAADIEPLGHGLLAAEIRNRIAVLDEENT